MSTAIATTDATPAAEEEVKKDLTTKKYDGYSAYECKDYATARPTRAGRMKLDLEVTVKG